MNFPKWSSILALAIAPLASFAWDIFPDDRMVPDKSTPELVALFQEFKAAAEKGDVAAQFKLGYCYYIGCGIPSRDYSLAKKWYIKAAEAGYPDAQFALMGLYSRSGDERDEHFKWLYKAAASKYPKAYHALGAYFEFGWGVPKDELESYAYYNLAAPFLPWSASSRDIMEKNMTSEQRLAGQKRSKEILKELEAKK